MQDVISVGIGTIGTATKMFTLAEGSKVKDLVAAAGMSTAGYTFRIAGNGDVSESHVLSNNDIVALVPNVKNGL